MHHLVSLRLSTLLATALLAPLAAHAQPMGFSEVRVGNDAEAWGADQGAFDPNLPVTVFMEFPSANHGGFQYSGVCVLALAATGQELSRVHVAPVWMQPGSDVIRTSQFQMGWPQAPVTLTCVPDYNPGLAMAVTLTPALYVGGSHQGSTGAPTPTPEPAGPDGAEVCRQAVLDAGWNPSGLSYCDGVNGTCASSVMSHGWNPSGLPGCVNVNEACAVELLDRGWNPSGLSGCELGVDEACAVELLRRGWDPSGLSYCVGVDSACAVGVLQAGYNPSSVADCGGGR